MSWLTTVPWRTFDEHIPVDCLQPVEPLLSLARVIQELHAAAQLELALPQQSLQSPNILYTERTTELHIVYQVSLASATVLGMLGSQPTLAIERRTTAGDQCVQVWMMLQLLVSGVQDHQGGRLVAAHVEYLTLQGFPDAVEQQVVQLLTVAEYQCR